MAIQANSTDLDCPSPDHVPLTMRYAAQKYRESVSDLQSAWQDPEAGLVWDKLADELDKSANRCEAIIAKHFK